MYYSFLTVLVLQDTVIQAVRVIGGNATVVQGDTVVLPCALTDFTEELTQVTWQRRTRQIKPNTNFYTILPKTGPQFFNGKDERFSFVGDFTSSANGSIQLTNVMLSDEGTYTCIFTLFPSGNYKTEIPLNVLVPPKASTENRFPFVGNEEVVLGSCKAASSWPPAKVEWHLENLSDVLRITHNSTENADGTTTTVSTLLGAPTRDLHNHAVQCVVSSLASPGGTSLTLTIQIHFPPSEVNISESSKNSFECLSEANPKANITWTRVVQWKPHSAVKVNGAVLQILKPSPELNGLLECKATNKYGTTQSHLYLHFSSGGTCTAAWTICGLLLFAIAAVAAVFYYRSDGKCTPPWRRQDAEQTVQAPEEEPGESLMPQVSESAVDD